MRAGRVVALTGAAIAVIGVVVAIPHTHRAGAIDATDFASLQPSTFVDKDPNVSGVTVTATLPVTPVTLAYTINGAGQGYREDKSPATMTIPVSEFPDCGPTTVTVEVDTLSDVPRTLQSQTFTVTRLCPTFTVSPSKVKGTDPVTITLQNWNSDGRFDSGFDSFGSYPDSAAYKKKLSVNGVKVDDEFGYKVTPTVKTPSLKDGDNTITLTQDSPFGTLTATATLNSWNSTWSVSPQGEVTTASQVTLTVSDSAKHCGGTTANFYLGTQTVAKKTISMTDESQELMPPATFSDDGYFFTSNPDNRYVRVEIVEGRSCSPIRFAAIDPDPAATGDPGPGGGFQPPPPPTPTIVQIPFTVLDPGLQVEHSDLDQSALPATDTVYLPGFDTNNDIYNNRDLQPTAVYVGEEKVGTTMGSQWTGPLSPPCGDSVLTARQATSFGTISIQTPLHVYCPQAQLSPAVIAKAAEPATVQLSGEKFHTSDAQSGVTRPYVVTVDGTQVANGDMDDAGAFTTSFVASGLDCGPHDVTVTELPSQGGAQLALPATPTAAADDPAPPEPNGPMTVTSSLTVNCPVTDPGQPGEPSHPGQPQGKPGTPAPPTLAVNPQGVIAGMRTFVTGTGFTPGHTITLTWTLSNGQTEPACVGTPVTVLPDRTIAALCLIPQHDTIGRRRLNASDGTRSAQADALIINSSMQPSGRNSRLVIRR